MKKHPSRAGGTKVCALAWSLGALAGLGLASTAEAGITLPKVSLGAGLRTDFSHNDNGGGDKSNDFAVDNLRLYINGSVTDHIKFTVDTDYKHIPGDSADSTVQVIDAIARFEYSPMFNIWAGRFLPPVDRADLYGPFYADNWAVYRDGVQDDYPSTAVGRDDGAAYWGQFGILKVQLGLFDVPATYGKSEVLTSGRLMIDLWDPEPGYYLNGTYFGEKNILALGISGQSSANQHVYGADFLMERNVHGVRTFTVESEYVRNSRLGAYGSITGLNPLSGTTCSGGCYADNHGYYVLLGYLLPQPIGDGRVQILGKYGSAGYGAPDAAIPTLPPQYVQHTSEFDLKYVIKPFDAAVTLFYLDQARDSGFADARTVGLGLQLQM